MGTYLNVALLQLAAESRDRAANLERGPRACRDARAAGAHVVLFPEMWSIGYELRDDEPVEELAKHAVGHRVDIHLQGPVMQIWDGEELIKTVIRTNRKEVRKKHAAKAS